MSPTSPYTNNNTAPRGSAAVILPIFSAMAFGLYPAASQRAYLDGADAQFVILITTLARAVFSALHAMYLGHAIIPKSGEWRWTLSGGLFQALSIVGIIGSLAYLPGPVMLTLVFTGTLMLLLFLVIRGEMKLDALTALTTLLTLLGVSLVVDVWSNISEVQWIGVALALMAAAASASRLYVFGRQLETLNPALVGARVFWAAFLLLLLSLFVSTPAAPQTYVGWFSVLGACISLVVGTHAMLYSIALVGSFRVSLTLKIEPIFTALFSLLIMNQVLNLSQYLGMLLVVSSLIMYHWVEALRRSSEAMRNSQTSTEPQP